MCTMLSSCKWKAAPVFTLCQHRETEMNCKSLLIQYGHFKLTTIAKNIDYEVVFYM